MTKFINSIVWILFFYNLSISNSQDAASTSQSVSTQQQPTLLSGVSSSADPTLPPQPAQSQPTDSQVSSVQTAQMSTTAATVTTSPQYDNNATSSSAPADNNQTATYDPSTTQDVVTGSFGCADSPVCMQIPNICNSTDTALVVSLCPDLCGRCPTTTTTTVPTTTPAPVCPDGHCQNSGVCVIVVGKPRCACPEGFIGAHCETVETTTVAASAPSTPETTASALNELTKEGCNKSDIVFLVEHIRGDSDSDVDHEADFIRNLALGWDIDNNHARVGVVVYGDHVRQKIDFAHSSGNKDRLIDTLENLARREGHPGTARVDSAVGYADRLIFSKDQRNDAQKVLVVIVHDMNSEARSRLAAATGALQGKGIIIYGVGADIKKEDSTALKAAVDHYLEFDDFKKMEDSLHGLRGPHDYC